MLPEKVAVFKGRLEIGQHGEDRITSHLDNHEQLSHFGEQVSEHIRPLTIINTADCMDDRRTLHLADGTSDSHVLRERIVPQWAGGLVLATTKAAVAANAAFLRDAKSMQQAYETTFQLLEELGFMDGGHEVCGASAKVVESVAQPVPENILLPTIDTILTINESRHKSFNDIQQNKMRRLANGFYSSWDPAWHQDFLSQKVPQNFSYLETANDAVHGHYAQGVVLVSEQGQGFAKNAFIEDTGNLAFAATPSITKDVSIVISSSAEERQRIQVAFIDDLINVSDKLVAPGMPVFSS